MEDGATGAVNADTLQMNLNTNDALGALACRAALFPVGLFALLIDLDVAIATPNSAYRLPSKTFLCALPASEDK